MKPLRKLSLFFLTLCLTAAALIPGAAAAGGPRLTVSSQEPASSQSIGFTGLPADCHSIQATFTLSADASCDFAPDSVLAGQPGVYTAFKQTGRAVTVYVTAKSGVLPTDGALTLGVLSSPETLFTVERASNLKLLTSDGEETTYPSVDTGSNGSGSSGGSGGSNSSGGNSGGSSNSGDSGDSGGGNEDTGLPFTDVVSGSWYYDSVAYVYEQGLMGSTGQDRFSPDLTTSRAMIVTILYRLENSPAVTTSAGFTDVAADTWYTEAVNWANANGIVTGYGDGRFGPEDTITREQMAVILYRTAKLLGRDVSARADLSGYTDAAQISSYARTAMAWAVDTGLLTGRTQTTLVPGGTATRAELAVILERFAALFLH